MISIKKCFAFLPLDSRLINNGDYGYLIVDKKTIPMFYFSKKQAIETAEDWAARNPKIPVIFLESTMVFEAKQPETSTKEFKDNGELIPKRQET